MKIPRLKIIQRTGRKQPDASKRSEDGMATLLFIALLAIMMLLVMANGRALLYLHNEINFLERQQIKRLNAAPTNAVVTVTSERK